LEPAWFYRVGNACIEIAGWAEQHGTELTVMGSHGRTALKGLVFGSVTQCVLTCRQFPCWRAYGAGAAARDQRQLIGLTTSAS
jgi:hypothetical protein